MVAGDTTKGMKTKAQLIKLLPIHTAKERKTFCNSDRHRSSHRPRSHVKRGLGNQSASVYGDSIPSKEKYLPLYLDRKNGARARRERTKYLVIHFFVPLKPHRKFDDSLGKMNYKLRLTNFLRASLVPLGYVPSGAGKKKQGIQY